MMIEQHYDEEVLAAAMGETMKTATARIDYRELEREQAAFDAQ